MAHLYLGVRIQYCLHLHKKRITLISKLVSFLFNFSSKLVLSMIAGSSKSYRLLIYFSFYVYWLFLYFPAVIDIRMLDTKMHSHSELFILFCGYYYKKAETLYLETVNPQPPPT
jgi:hypothetical protein